MARENSHLRGVIGEICAKCSRRVRRSYQRDRGMAPVPVHQSASFAECDQGITNPREALVTGWRDIILRFKNGMRTNNVSVVAAGVAFLAHLSIIAALAAMVAAYGLLADPYEVSQHLKLHTDLLP
jgi:hypothetical protein